MNVDWRPLDAALAQWQGDLPLWWRDDDAIDVTPSLDRLLELSDLFDMPVHLAIIPAHITKGLADLARRDDRIIPLVHGWTHVSHAPMGMKKAEFGPHRPVEVLLQEAQQGIDRLRDALGEKLAPVFVPPWNRVAPDLLGILPDLGFHTLSTFSPRSSELAAPGLRQVNTHIDPIDWRGTRSAVAPDTIVQTTADLLSDRLTGATDRTEPLGLLTHHLVHDEAIWSITRDLACRLSKRKTCAWRAI